MAATAAADSDHQHQRRRRVLVIGAGTAGLCSAKNALEQGLEVVIYEQTKLIGGLWNYTDETGVDEHGLPFGYMYRELKTNVPKEIMCFTDFAVKIEDKWFLDSEDVVQFLHSYARHFKVDEVIRFHHQVVRVLPYKDGRWEVLVKNLTEDRYFTEFFDFVMVCNGHHFHPIWPKIPGQDLFPGVQKHSFDFRCKEEFKDKRVLVVGSGPSALDIAVLLSESSATVFLAHHIPFRAAVKVAPNMVLKPDVLEITAAGAIFNDGSDCTVDAIIYCTGFKYSFPFLSTECGVHVEDNYVQPLFKHVINIRHPTMAFVGLNFLIAAQMHFDMQAQFAVQMWTGRQSRAFPSEEEMLQDTARDLEVRLKRGWKRKHGHKMGDLAADYYQQLAEYTPGMRLMAPVFMKIWKAVGMSIFTNYLNYRNDRYHVVDEETFVKTEAASGTDEG